MKTPLNSWKKLSSRVVYRNAWMQLREDRVRHRNGRGIYAFVSKQPGVIIVAVTPKREVWMVGQWRYPTGEYSWELPMGTLNQGENWIDGAKRELLEEMSLTASRWTFVGTFFFAPGSMNQLAVLYVARGLRTKTGQPDATEDLQHRRISLAKFEKLVRANVITDGPTIAAYYRAKPFLR